MALILQRRRHTVTTPKSRAFADCLTRHIDKIAASKQKGIWVGGPVPLGYASIAKKLAVVPEEADIVRMIFTRGTSRSGPCGRWRRNSRMAASARSSAPFPTGARLAGVGSGSAPWNRFYIGEVVYRGEIFRGSQEAILDASLFAAVQAKLSAQAVERRCTLRGRPARLR